MTNKPPTSASSTLADDLAAATKAANTLTEEDLACGLDGMDDLSPQGGEHHSHPYTCRIKASDTNWIDRNKGPTKGELRR